MQCTIGRMSLACNSRRRRRPRHLG